MKFIYFVIAILFAFSFCKYEEGNDKFDTSDNNPIAYCLRLRNGFTDDEIANFLVEIQDPEKAVALFPYGGKLSQCVQKRTAELEKQNEEENVRFDTSDNNPIAYCLRLRNGYNDDEILNFLVEIQDPEKAVALFPYGGKLSQCVQKRNEELKEKTEEENVKFDTSDNNPIAYCLRLRNGYNDEEILKFLIEIQEPEKAVGLFPYGGKLSQCVKKRLAELREENEEN